MENSEKNLPRGDLKMFDEMNETEKEAFSKQCLKAALDLISSLAIQDGLELVNLDELHSKYELMIGEDSETVRNLIKYAGFLQYHAVMLYSSSIADMEMSARLEIREGEKEKKGEAPEDGIGKLGLD